MRDARIPPLLVVSAVGTLLGFEALRAFFSTIYFRNLTTLGINASVLWALLLLAPAVLLIPALRASPARAALGAAAALALGRLGMNTSWGTGPYLALAGLAAAAWLVLVPALARASAFDEGGPGAVAVGVGAGLAADVALGFAQASDDVTVRPVGLLLVAPAALALVVFAWRGARDPPPATLAPGGVRAGLALGAWLFLELAVLGAPFHVARWNAVPIPSAAVGSLGGLLVGSALAAWPLGASRRRLATIAGAVALLIFLVDHGFVHSPFVPALLVAAQAGAVLALAAIVSALSRASPGRAAVGALMGALFALVALFAFAFAYQFAFVPLGSLWDGRAHIVLLVGFVALALGVLPAAGSAARGSAGSVALAIALVLPALAAVPAFVVDAPDAKAPRGGGELRVLSFNVHQAFNNDGVVDPQAFVRVLREEDADVVVLQESDTPRFTSANVDVVGILARDAGYAHVLYGPATREQNVGLTILSRLPLLDGAVVKLPSGSDNRFLVRARIVANGTDLWVFGVHMGLPTADREAQIDVILREARAAGGRRILVGDFNSCPEGRCPREDEPPDGVWRKVTAEYADTWNATGRNATEAGYTFGAPDPYQRIDYVFFAGVGVRDARVVRSEGALRASDHLPVRVELRV